ncbi:hypothetical protein LWI28_026403 [Acer negundo]|uniref:MULE transposase domain-containing protein n=1 Tax=Acer negundo TaxID=4023 RepID=A0AAD5ISL8_ACENE|nr:hypothetical protein LWI28_026403 [Acer negundo]
MALGPSIEGFKSCIHPVVAVDGNFLKCKHQGTLFIATSSDGNNEVYPLVFGIGDSENDQSWHWFFTKLHGLIGEMDDLVFISDRNTSIAKAATGVFPNSLHGICMYHLGQNMKAKFKGVEVHDIFYKCSKVYRVVEFNQIMRQIRGINASVVQYLNEADPTKWVRSHFDRRRYCIITTNIAECLNGILKDARELPITKLVEHIRGLLQKWFWERREAAVKMNTPMTKWAKKKLHHMHLLLVTFVVLHVMTIAPIITIRKNWLQLMVVPFTPLGLSKSGMFPMMYKVVLFYHQKTANLADVR